MYLYMTVIDFFFFEKNLVAYSIFRPRTDQEKSQIHLVRQSL
jgi:hypothetical protein